MTLLKPGPEGITGKGQRKGPPRWLGAGQVRRGRRRVKCAGREETRASACMIAGNYRARKFIAA